MSNTNKYITLNVTVMVAVDGLSKQEAIKALDNALVNIERANQNSLDNPVRIFADLTESEIRNV